jgi:CheY-like chemotaxis protein
MTQDPLNQGPATAGRITVLLIDSNVFYAKRLAGAIEKEGLDVIHSTQVAYALTMLEWQPPAAIVCATNLRELSAFDLPPLLQADPKTAHIPVIAMGDGGEQALMAAFRAGCTDFVDRRLGPEQIAAHLRELLRSQRDGFQPTQMLSGDDTGLSGNLSHLDLPSVVQMLAQSRKSGALHINFNDLDGVIFFAEGDITHAECGDLIGDDAVITMVKSCNGANAGVYKFVPGDTVATRTVLRSATALMLDACRELDERSVSREVN